MYGLAYTTRGSTTKLSPLLARVAWSAPTHVVARYGNMDHQQLIDGRADKATDTLRIMEAMPTSMLQKANDIEAFAVSKILVGSEVAFPQQER